MSQTVLVGTDGQAQAGLYGGVTPTTYEEGGTNGFGTRMTPVRQFYRWFTQPIGTADVNYFNSGHLLIVSVSNLTAVTSGFTFKQMAAGAYDTDIDAMFDRIYALNFDSNVTALSRSVGTTNTSPNLTGTFTQADVGAGITGTGIPASTTILSQTGTAAVMSANATATGSPTASITQGITQPYVVLILQHEVDRGAANNKLYGTDTVTDYINAWIHMWNRGQARATANSKPASRVRYCWCCTSYGFDINRAGPYYPGNQYVDVIGSDPYGNNSTTSWTNLLKATEAFCRTKGKPLMLPEVNNIADDSTTAQNWWIDAGVQMNASDIRYEAICIWVAAQGFATNYYQYNINKLAAADTGGHSYPLKHAGIATMIANLGNNAIRTATTQALPSAATGVAVSSSTDGKSATMTWANPPVGDNVTGWYWYLGNGTTTVLVNQNASTPLAAGARSVTIPNLTPGATYSADPVPFNVTGKAGFGSIATFTTSNPGAVNHAPVISSFTAVPETASPLSVDYNITASDPDGNAITITVVVTAAAIGFTETFTMTSGIQATRSYVTPGSYTAVATVSDGTLTTTTTTTFGLTNSGNTTPGQSWNVDGLLPGRDPRGVGKTMLGIVQDLDTTVTQQQQIQSTWNAIHNLAGSSYDPVHLSTGLLSTASGWLTWSAVQLQALSFSGLVVVVNQVLVGSGATVGIYDAAGNVLVDDQGNIASYSGTAVDNWLHNGGVGTSPTSFTLPVRIINRKFGEVLYVGLFFPPTTITTYPQLFGAGTLSQAMALNLTNRRASVVTGQSSLPSSLPLTTGVGGGFFVGLLP